MTTTISLGEGTLRIELPGSYAVLVDVDRRVVAFDGVSGTGGGDPLLPEWTVLNLSHGIYGDFHQLRPSAECNDADCASSQHVVTCGWTGEAPFGVDHDLPDHVACVPAEL